MNTPFEDWKSWLDRNLPEGYDMSSKEGEFYAFKSCHRLNGVGFRKVSILNPNEPKEEQQALTQEVFITRNNMEMNQHNGALDKPKADPTIIVDELEEGKTLPPEEEAVDLQQAFDLAEKLLKGENPFDIDDI